MQFINPVNAHAEFQQKSVSQQQLINEALYILQALGIPFQGMTLRRLERMALAFLAVADVQYLGGWVSLKDETSGRSLRTRDVIKYVNQHFGENISSGSYDDIRRKDLAFPVQAGIVVSTRPNSAPNNSMRGYAVSADHADIIRAFGNNTWEAPVKAFMESRVTLTNQLYAHRSLTKTTIRLPSGQELDFSPGEHNILQKAIIEEFYQGMVMEQKCCM